MGIAFSGAYAQGERPGWYREAINRLVSSGLQVGDIIVYQNRGIPSGVISRCATHDERTHVGIYLREGKVGQIVHYYGLARVPCKKPRQRKWGTNEIVSFEDTLASCKGFVVYRPNASDEVKATIPGFVEGRVGTKNRYDTYNLLKHLSNEYLGTWFRIKPRKNDKKLSCATLATRAYESQGYGLGLGLPDTRLPMPNDIREIEGKIAKLYDIDLTSDEMPLF